MWPGAQNAATTISPTTPAKTGIARSARDRRRGTGWRRVRTIFFRSSIFTWSSPCLRRSRRSPTGTSGRSTGCCSRCRPKQAVPVLLRHNTQQQSRQNEQLCRDHRTRLRPSQAARPPSAAPLMQPLLQPSAHFPHSMIQDPRGFLLGRFSDAGRGRASAQRLAATRIRKPSPNYVMLQDV